MRKYFGTDGIRRIANTELTPELVYKVAKAGAYVLAKHLDHAPTILIGRDTRLSGTLIEYAKGLRMEYPDGFTKDNTFIVSKLLDYNGHYNDFIGIGLGPAYFNAIFSVGLYDSYIEIMNVISSSDDSVTGKSFKILLMKIE